MEEEKQGDILVENTSSNFISNSDGSYDIQSLRAPQHVADIGRECLALHHVYGLDMTRKGNLFLIQDEKIIYASANSVIFENTVSGEKEYLMGIDDGGIGCVTIHPSRKYFAVGGKGNKPNIYIYSYPQLKVLKVLPGGAERGYACLTFNRDGDKLASVSTSPDFMLTVWDWEVEQMGLHAKAFGQDVINVKFSLDDPRRLTTSGTGHIRFWKMAATFTGLKLQGSIGKFGKIDLSDIDNFIELPDGKVISGTETGSLLLWEGNFIKCRFVKSSEELCHNGNITYLDYDRSEKCVISASDDGYIRWWDFTTIDTAEVDSDHSMDFKITPLAEYFIGKDVGVKALLDSGCHSYDSLGLANSRYFIILDTKGKIQSLNFSFLVKEDGSHEGKDLKLVNVIQSLKGGELEVDNEEEKSAFLAGDDYCVAKTIFNEFHYQAITGVDTCPLDHLVASCSSDGSIKCINYVTKKEIACRYFSIPATSLKWVPSSLDPTGKSVAVGFADGTVRILFLGNKDGEPDKISWIRKMVMKPHNAPVLDMAYNRSGSILATAGKDGIIFFLRCTIPMGELSVYSPLSFVTVVPSSGGKSVVSAERVAWSPNDSSLLCSSSDGVAREIDLQKLNESMLEFTPEEEIVSYEAYYPIKDFSTKIPVPVTNKSSTASLPAATTSSENKTEEKAEEIPLVPIKVSRALYTVHRLKSGFVAAAGLAQKSYLLEFEMDIETPTKELVNGRYSADGKDLVKNPVPNFFSYSWSKQFLLTGLTDGSLIIRPSEFLETFMRTISHNNVTGGVSLAACSFDDRFVISVGKDCTLSIFKLRLDLVNERATGLYKDLDAGVFGDDVIKPEPKTKTPDPLYLELVNEVNEKLESHNFLSLLTMKKPAEVLQDIAEKPIEEEASDLNPGAYSIQDNRLKLEEDAKKVAADELKDRIRASVAALRRDYDKVNAENMLIPAEVRLKPNEMIVDKSYFQKLELDGEKMLDEVHKECAYEAEIAYKRHEKLTNRMMNGLLIEEVTLSAFDVVSDKRLSKSIVKSLRAKSLDPNVVEILKEVQSMVRETELKDAQLKTNETAQKKALETVDEMKSRMNKKEDEPATAKDFQASATNSVANPSQSEPENPEHIGSSVNVRRANRLMRKEKISKHNNQKPNENTDDIRDLNAIKLAEKTIGDYKLKVSDDYEVPEEQRVNASKKIKQMAMLEESMLKMRLQFDERFLILRHLKREIIYSIRRDNKRIRDIDTELKQSHLSENLWTPTFDPTEFPDDCDEVTEMELNKYSEIRSKQPWEKAIPPQNNIVTGMKTEVVRNPRTGNFEVVSTHRNPDPNDTRLENYLSDSKLVDFTPERHDVPKYYEMKTNVLYPLSKFPKPKETKRLNQLESSIPILAQIKDAGSKRLTLGEITPKQELLNEERFKILAFERKMLTRKIEENVIAFRDAIDDLRLDRHIITSDLKLGELKLLILYQEFKLLQTFEGKDNTLQQKQLRCKAEETEISISTNENKVKLDTKIEEIRHWNDKLTQLNVECRSILPESHPYFEPLSKIFKKKIKRSKGNEDENEDEEEDEEEEDDDDDDDEEVEDICPPGCDQVLFEKILDLREKKIDTEEITAEIQKGIDELKKTIDRLKQREKQIVKEAQQTEAEVQLFQLQKQAALNQIPIIVPLKMSQIMMFEKSGKISGPTDKILTPDTEEYNEFQRNLESLKNIEDRMLAADIDMKSHTLFTNRNLLRLKSRIDELHEEIDQAKNDFKQLHKERGVLLKESESKKQSIELWSSRCKDLQMLKFGSLIDLDELEAISDRSQEVEAENLLKSDEQIFKSKMVKLMKEAAVLQEELFAVTDKNTNLLNEVADLSEGKLQISRELNNAAPVAHSSKLDNFREAEETKRIAAYIKFQANEIESLRAELNMLKRKEAPPVMPIPTIPMPVQSPLFSNSNNQSTDLILPPIPNNKKSTGR